MFKRPVDPEHQPFSRQTAAKASRLRGATVTESVCPYCAVGCGQLIYTKGGKLIDIEGNPRQPDQRGHALPQGGRTPSSSPSTRTASRRSSTAPPTPTTGRRKPLDWALDQIARRVKDGARRRLHGAQRRRAACSTRCAPSARSAARRIDNEENYLIKKLFGGGLGVVSIENQARI